MMDADGSRDLQPPPQGGKRESLDGKKDSAGAQQPHGVGRDVRHMYIYMTIYLSIYLSISIYIYLFISLSIYLSIYLSL
jgi:hypothetical protein